MIEENGYLTPPKRLAIAYAPAADRPFFRLLLEFDGRLAQIVASHGEAVIAQMRMAWWRDVITKDAVQRPLGEPMVAQLNAFEDGRQQDAMQAMLQIVDGWDILLAHEEWSYDVLVSHARSRAAALFGDVDQAAQAGETWALQDLANNIGCDVGIERDESGKAFRPKARHLSILSLSAQQQYCGANAFSALRLFAHGLTGL